MDRANEADLVALFDGDGSRVHLLGEFGHGGRIDVPDPYLEADRFAEVLEMIEFNCRALLGRLSLKLAEGRPGPE